MPIPRSYARAGRWACTALAATLCACTTIAPAPTPPPATRPPAVAPAQRPLPNVNLSGYPPAFKEGFRDGCDSFRGIERRDANRFNKDNDYTIGWQDGFSICRRQGK
jgi:hypothetical protein